ncbi:hypothetical protein ACIHDR_44655 [Nocardia sp. NPDC052278]
MTVTIHAAKPIIGAEMPHRTVPFEPTSRRLVHHTLAHSEAVV